MNLDDAETLARKLMAEWLPAYWTFEWSRTRRTYGDCTYGTATIRLSRIQTETRTREAVENTIRHEIAHALAGATAGHGPAWKHYARIVGADPRRVSAEHGGNEIAFKWVATCGTCGAQDKKHRLSRDMTQGMWACGPCCRTHSNGEWDSRFALTFVKQY